jgi:hypothetical protein
MSIQVQVLVENEGEYDYTQFKKIKSSAFTLEAISKVCPMIEGGEVEHESGSVIVINLLDAKITFVKQQYV